MNLLVTGHCGFIGQNFVKLFAKDHNIVGIDKMTYASSIRAAARCTTYSKDISTLDFRAAANKIISTHGPFDAIINFAAESHVDNSINSPEQFIYSNIVGTFNMLEIAREHGIKKFLQVGTDEVYGDLQADDPPFSNFYELKPSSPYSASKAAADVLVLSYFRTYNMDVTITRSSNNYGPHQHHEKLIPTIIKKALNDEPVPIYGTGLNMREWIHVEDNCRGIMAALINGRPGEIYNLGSGFEETNIDLCRQILELMEKPESLLTMVEDRKGHDFRYFLDCEKSHKELDWHSTIDFQEGLRGTIDHYVNSRRKT
jgi:dTDP-glucose 4,6-dehydratase